MMRPVQSPFRQNAFTVLELLIVVAILFILAAVLLPALGRAKGRARQIVCANNLNQWTMTQIAYANDNEGYIARESYEQNGVTLNNWDEVRHVNALDVWYNVLPAQLKMPRARDYAPVVLRGDFYFQKSLFHCPDARFQKGIETNKVVYFSLAMNSKLILLPFGTMLLDSIQRPSDTVMFLDNRLPDEPRIEPLQADNEIGQPSAYANRAAARHQGRVNLSFADGHVQPFRGSALVTNGLAPYPQRPVIWTADPNRNPNLD